MEASFKESISNSQLGTLVDVFGNLQKQVEKEDQDTKESIDNILNDYEEGLKNTQEVDSFSNNKGDSEDDAEVYNDTLKHFESGTNASKNDLINALRSFRFFNLPVFKKEYIQRVRCPLLFQGTYISKTAMDKLNKELKWDIAWRAGFIVAKNAEVIAIKFSPKKNVNNYHTDQIDKFLRVFGKKSGIKRKLHFGQWQLLKGYACKPIYPDIEDIIPSGAFNFIGK